MTKCLMGKARVYSVDLNSMQPIKKRLREGT